MENRKTSKQYTSNSIKLYPFIFEILALSLFFTIIFDSYLEYREPVEFIEYEGTFSCKKKAKTNYIITLSHQSYSLLLGKSNIHYKNFNKIKKNESIVYTVRKAGTIADYWNSSMGLIRIVALESRENGVIKSTEQYLERREEVYFINVLICFFLVLLFLLIIHSWGFFFISNFESRFYYFNNPLIGYKKKEKGVPPQK